MQNLRPDPEGVDAGMGQMRDMVGATPVTSEHLRQRVWARFSSVGGWGCQFPWFALWAGLCGGGHGAAVITRRILSGCRLGVPKPPAHSLLAFGGIRRWRGESRAECLLAAAAAET